MSLILNTKLGSMNLNVEGASDLHLTLRDYGLNPGDWSICSIDESGAKYRLSHRRERGLCLLGHWNADTHWHSLEWDFL